MDLKLADRLSPETVITNLKAREKMGAIREIAEHLVKKGLILNNEEFLRAIDNRENLESTGIGDGIAIPHAKTDAVRDLILTLAISKAGVDFEAVDGKPSHIIFMIVSPDSHKGEYIRILARLSKLVRKKGFKDRLLEARSKAEIIDVIRGLE
ncbi:PTS sugar transporter subunit IIA [candidate division WOR-3 bacterium]|uniref:PTS sugar transporter subunit IIA n=1 Tax=candidate division WOR-3 bacterium TaxID=2052148 RepID=A0A660SHF4_UNCW3|nr:MAG: PTS sugar transporter subunit IIA [candidate division WOR-3 bacterium]